MTVTKIRKRDGKRQHLRTAALPGEVEYAGECRQSGGCQPKGHGRTSLRGLGPKYW